jgi:archaellum component FlaC
VPESERKLREELDTARRRLAEANEHIQAMENDNAMLARIVNVLATENAGFREQLQTTSSTVVRPFTREVS